MWPLIKEHLIKMRWKKAVNRLWSIRAKAAGGEYRKILSDQPGHPGYAMIILPPTDEYPKAVLQIVSRFSVRRMASQVDRTAEERFTQVCSWCTPPSTQERLARVKQADGVWRLIVHRDTRNTSHGMCPACAAKARTELQAERERRKIANA
jgi:hypothetical protein